MKFQYILEVLLFENNKIKKAKEKLINLGVNETNADALSEVARGLSIFFANKILKKINQVPSRDIKQAMSLVNQTNAFVNERDNLTTIMDWVDNELNGNIEKYRNKTYDEIYNESVEWKKSLNAGTSKINYEEKNKVIIDFRINGEGYYWINLNKFKCTEEELRMGHCGESRGTLYSLRSTKKIGTNKTINKSHLNAGIKDGKLLELKGKLNSKPKELYHPYILELLKYRDEYGDYLIHEFGVEHDRSNDFNIFDLSLDKLEDLYYSRSDMNFFNSVIGKYLLNKKGLDIDLSKYRKYKFIVDVDNFKTFIGNNHDIVEDILTANPDVFLRYDDLNIYRYYDDVFENINFTIDEPNKNLIKEKLNIDINNDNIESNNKLEKLIERSVNKIICTQYLKHLTKELASALNDIGKVIDVNYGGIAIETDLIDLFEDNNIDVYSFYELECRYDDIKCMFDMFFHETSFYPNLDYAPKLNIETFNKELNKLISYI